MTEKNREEWLAQAAAMIEVRYSDVFEEHFGKEGRKHLKGIKVSTGFPGSRGLNGKVIGECWASRAAADGKAHHIFISPLLVDPVRVVSTLAHEMVHAADDGESKHKGKFTKAIRGMGLEGKPTATYAGEEFTAFAQDVVAELGDYPHVGLTPVVKEKVQKTYMLKLECPGCGCIVRMTQKWLDEAGAPFCGTRAHVIDGERTDRRIRMEVAS